MHHELSILDDIQQRPLASLDDVKACYREILHRDPDAGGLRYYQDLIAHGLPRRSLIQRIASSEELKSIPDPAHHAKINAALTYLDTLPAGAANEIEWFHSIPLKDGLITPGRRPIDILQREADHIFRMEVNGKSVLDIGAWDGFFSFEAERRGARDVLSTDHFCWSGPGWGTKQGYDFAHKTLGSTARSQDVDVFALDPSLLGTFDVVLFLGVLYHLKDPYGGLERAAAMTDNLLIVETETACNHFKEPVMRHYLHGELADDTTNFFAPNIACLTSMLKEIGFDTIHIARNPGTSRWKKWYRLTKNGALNRDRHIVHAWRDAPWA